MTTIEIILSIATVLAFIVAGLFYHKNSVIEVKHEFQLKELEVLFNNQISNAQNIVKEYESYIEAYQKYFIQLNEIIHISDIRLKQIDSKGSFKSDDEVGFFFKNLQEIQNTLNEFDFTASIIKSQAANKDTIIGPDGKPIPKENYIPYEKVQELLNTK